MSSNPAATRTLDRIDLSNISTELDGTVPMAFPPELVPPEHISIMQFLRFDFPAQPATLVLENIGASYSIEAPNEDLHACAKRPIPPQARINYLHQKLPQAWADGARSVVDNTRKSCRSPMEAVSYWKEIDFILQKRRIWEATEGWLESCECRPGHLEAADEARTLMNHLPWGQPLCALGALGPAESLASLLSDKPLASDIIDMLSTHLSNCARRDANLAQTVVVASTLLAQSIMACYRDNARNISKPNGIMKRYQGYFTGDQPRTKLYLVANNENEHWVAIEIDFTAHILRYGDSNATESEKPDKYTAKLLESILTWLLHTFKVTFRNSGNTLPRGRQDDGFSCGVCAVNALEAALFRIPLFEHRRRRLLRIEYFNVLLHAHVNYRSPSRISSDFQQAFGSPPVDLPKLASAPVIPSDLSIAIALESPHSSHPNLPSHDSPPRMPGDMSIWSESELPLSAILDGNGANEAEAPEHRASIAPDTDQETEISLPALSTSPVLRPMEVDDERPLPCQSTLPAKNILSDTSSESDSSPSAARNCSKSSRARSPFEGGPTGIGLSTIAGNKLRKAMVSGTLVVHPTRLGNYEKKLYEIHPNAEMRYGKNYDNWEVFCPKCQGWWNMKEPYDTSRYREHMQTCSGRQKGSRGRKASGSHGKTSASNAGAHTLDFFAARDGWIKHSSPRLNKALSSAPNSKSLPRTFISEDDNDNEPTFRSIPCSGITEAVKGQVSVYLSRPSALGGGARSVTRVARELFGANAVYSKLNDSQKHQVSLLQRSEHAWRNDYSLRAVFSTSCHGKFRLATNSMGQQGSKNEAEKTVCSECRKLLSLPAFRTALNVKMPSAVNVKFTNKQYQNEELARIFAKCRGLEQVFFGDDAKDTTEYAKFASLLVNGELGNDFAVMRDMFKALHEIHGREERGVGRQNFRYGSSLTEFANVALITSPELYRTMFKTMKVLPTERGLKRVHAGIPRFPLSIEDRTFSDVVRYIEKLEYHGPIALSCDDTKLHAALRTFWDPSKQVHVLVGGTGTPPIVTNAEALEPLLKELDDKKAPKLRLWCAHVVGVLKIPPIILAAKAIASNLKVSELYAMSLQIIEGCSSRGLKTVSYACDGTDTERNVQTALSDEAPSHITFSLSHPLAPCSDLTIEIPVYNGQPIVMIQDSNHARKTYRNNLFSGAHLLVLGNDVATYEDGRVLAFDKGGPLYHRDWEKVDRQDDNAATRTTSAAALEHLAQHHPHMIALITYLFVFGELVDAYQNRLISHEERIRMVLRAYYFLETWRAYLRQAGYAENRYLISRQAIDITHRLVHGYLSLVIVYRDHLQDESVPLYPWLHATETCEHVFAECRKLVKDFTYLDFLYAVPRLHVMLRSILNLSISTDAKARASGYSHSYIDNDQVDSRVLSRYPTDTCIQSINKAAFEESESLWILLGVTPSDVLQPDVIPSYSLPSLMSWWPSSNNHALRQPQDPFDLEDAIHEDDPEDESEDEAQKLEDLLAENAKLADSANCSIAINNRMEQLTCAAVALNLDDIVRIQSLSESITPEDEDRNYSGDRETIIDAYQHAALNLPTLNLPPEPIRPFDKPYNAHLQADFTPLLEARFRHQTARAAKSVRVGHSTSANTNSPGLAATAGNRPIEPSARQQLIRKINDTMRQYSDKGVGTGLERSVRWKGPTGTTAGNAANAALASGQRASAVMQRRGKIFIEHKLPRAIVPILTDAGIGKATNRGLHIGELQRDSLCLVVAHCRLFIARIITVYTRSGGKAATHGWVKSADNIGTISYVAVQLYQHAHEATFRAIIRETASVQTHAFAHLSSDCILQRLAGAWELSRDRRILTVDSKCLSAFRVMQDAQTMPRILSAVAGLVAARRKAAKRAGPGTGVDSGEDVD